MKSGEHLIVHYPYCIPLVLSGGYGGGGEKMFMVSCGHFVTDGMFTDHAEDYSAEIISMREVQK